MGEIIWKCLFWGAGTGRTGEGGDGTAVCVSWLGMGVGGCKGCTCKHHYHIKDMLGFSVLMVIILPTIGAHCSDHNTKKKNSKNWFEG